MQSVAQYQTAPAGKAAEAEFQRLERIITAGQRLRALKQTIADYERVHARRLTALRAEAARLEAAIGADQAVRS